jgi:hypothetical protein
MRLKALVIATTLMAYAAPVMAQGVEVHDHSKKKDNDKGHVEVRGRAAVEARVSGFSPASGPVGTAVTINGDGFNPKTRVEIGGRPVRVTAVTPTTITFTIPNRYYDGVITVRQPGQGNAIPVGTFQVNVDPRINSFQPTSGAAGTRVELSGEGFQPGDQVLFNGRPLALSELTATRAVVVIPQGASTDVFTVSRPQGNYRWASKQRFTVLQPSPTVSGLNPASGGPGTQVRITGTYFSADDRVSYGPQPINVIGRSDTWIDVQVPGNARQSNPFTIKTSRGNVQTATFVLALAPRIVRFVPDEGGPGTRVDIWGDNFQQGDVILLNGRPLKRLDYDEHKIAVEIPNGATTDRFVVQRGGQGMETARKPFEVYNAPTIAGFAPTSGPGGTKVTIRGNGFGNDARVAYGAQQLQVIGRRGDNEIDVIVPRNAQSLPFTVNTRAGSVSTASAFQVQANITSVSPMAGEVGTKVTITGDYFGKNPTVKVGAYGWPLIRRTETSITVLVSEHAPVGKDYIVIEDEGRQLRYPQPFEVLAPKAPLISSISPLRGEPGTKVTISGDYFGPKMTVKVGNVGWPVIKRSDKSITVLVSEVAVPGSDYLVLEDEGRVTKATQPFEVIGRPAPTGYSPTSGPYGTKVTIIGNYFEPTTKVYLSSRELPVESRTPTTLVVTIPDGVHTDWLYVVDGNRKLKLDPQYKVTASPTPAPPPPPPAPPAGTCSYAASPASLAAGNNVTVDIANCNVKNVKKAWFKGKEATIVQVTATVVVIRLPANVDGNDYVSIETDDGKGVAQRNRTSNKISVRAAGQY